MQATDLIDFVHTGPDTLAGRYLRTFWQPVYRAEELAPGRAIPIRIMGEDFTLYRGESGRAQVVAFRCAHRGTQLSVGWVEDDCIRCRYHGWMYDASGQCVEQPGEDPASAARVSIRSYPTEEYLGLTFAYLGDGPAPPLRRYRDFDQPGALGADPPEVWPCNFWNRLDNDPFHLRWAHRNTNLRMGRPDSISSLDATHYTETDWGVASSIPDGSTNHFHMPNTNQIKVRHRTPGFERLWEYRLIWHVPIDDESSVAFDVNLTPGLVGAEAERFRILRRDLQEEDPGFPLEIAEAILAGKMRIEDVDPTLSFYKQFWIEDYVTQVGQGPIADRAHEHLWRNDAKPMLKRALWQRELRALAEGRPLKEWRAPALFPAGENG
jgi:5,5'-dehydrodivanillate O-demethylase oxygenase subunit